MDQPSLSPPVMQSPRGPRRGLATPEWATGPFLTPGCPQVCNHKGKCHCQPGWAPPHCTEPLAQLHLGKSPRAPGAFTPTPPNGAARSKPRAPKPRVHG